MISELWSGNELWSADEEIDGRTDTQYFFRGITTFVTGDKSD